MQSKYNQDEETIKETFTRNFQMPVGDSAPSVCERHTSPTDRSNQSDAHTCSYGRLYYHIYIVLSAISDMNLWPQATFASYLSPGRYLELN